MTREQIQQLIDTNVPDNSSKLITAAMMREVLDAIQGSSFNKESDHVEDTDYDGTTTMQDLVAEIRGSLPLWGSTGSFAFGGSSGAIGGDRGIVTASIKTILSSSSIRVAMGFNQNIEGKRVVVNIMTDSADTNGNNSVGAPVVRQLPFGIEVGIRSIPLASPPDNMWLQVLVFGNQ